MNNNGIVSYSALNQENIKRSDYTNTLAAEAFRVGLMRESEIDALRNDLMNALAEIISLYTKNESSSVKAETARDLTASMMFNIDTYLLTLGDHEKALETLKHARHTSFTAKAISSIRSSLKLQKFSTEKQDLPDSKTPAKRTTRLSTSTSTIISLITTHVSMRITRSISPFSNIR
jgi:hypothetical protein